MCLGRNKRIEELERRIAGLESQTTFRCYPRVFVCRPERDLSVRDVVRAIVRHLGIDFVFTLGQDDRWEIVEKAEEAEEE